MGNLSKYAGIAALITLVIPVVLGRYMGLFYMAMLLGILALLLGFMSRDQVDQGRSAKMGMVAGGLALTVNFLTTLLY